MRDFLPKSFTTIEQFWDFWDKHSSADYEDYLEDVTCWGRNACMKPEKLLK